MPIGKIVALSCKRRGKEMRLVRVVTFLVALFLAGLLLYQQCAQRYMEEWAKQTYGDWVVDWASNTNSEAVLSLQEHPYLGEFGIMRIGERLIGKINPETGFGSPVGTIGVMNDRMQEMANLQYYEGHYPQADHEIAVETSVLSALSLPYELGQELQAYYEWKDKNGDTHRELLTYTVVGIFHNYSSIWSVQEGAGTALITEAAFAQLHGNKNCHSFFPLKEAYQEIDTLEFFKNLDLEIREQFKKQNIPLNAKLVYNANRFDVTLWESDQDFMVMGGVLILIGIAALVYLLLLYLNKRAPYYQRYRSIGMGKRSLRSLILYECGFVTIPVAGAGILLAYGVAIVICMWLQYRENMENLFTFEIRVLVLIIIGILATLFSASFMAMWISGRSRIRTSVSELSPSCMKRLRRNPLSNKGKIDDQLQKRERRQFPVRMSSMRLLSVGVTFVTLVCGVQLYEQTVSYLEKMERWDDFTADYQEISTYTFADGMKASWGGEHDLASGFPDEFFEVLESMPGLKKWEGAIKDHKVLFDWPGRVDSPILNLVYQEDFGVEDGKTHGDVLRPIEENDPWISYGCYFTDDPKVYDMLGSTLETVSWDIEKVLAGEEAILIALPYSAYVSGEMKMAKETTIQIGDTLTIQSENKTAEIQVRIGGIVEDLESVYPPEYWEDVGYIGAHYSLVGSHTLGERLAEAKGIPYRVNDIVINFENGVDYETSIKKTAGLLSAYGANYYSRYDEKQVEKAAVQQAWIVYGSFIVMLLAFYLIIRVNLWEAIAVFRQKRIRLLRQNGMEEWRIRRMHRKDGIREVLWGVLVIPFVYWNVWKWSLDNYEEQLIAEGWSVENIPELMMEYRSTLLEQMKSPGYLIVCIVLLMILLSLVMLVQERRVLQKPEEISKL